MRSKCNSCVRAPDIRGAFVPKFPLLTLPKSKKKPHNARVNSPGFTTLWLSFSSEVRVRILGVGKKWKSKIQRIKTIHDSCKLNRPNLTILFFFAIYRAIHWKGIRLIARLLDAFWKGTFLSLYQFQCQRLNSSDESATFFESKSFVMIRQGRRERKIHGNSSQMGTFHFSKYSYMHLK